MDVVWRSTEISLHSGVSTGYYESRRVRSNNPCFPNRQFIQISVQRDDHLWYNFYFSVHLQLLQDCSQTNYDIRHCSVTFGPVDRTRATKISSQDRRSYRNGCVIYHDERYFDRYTVNSS